MPTFYNFTRDGLVYSFDDIFVPSELFQEGNIWTWGQQFSSTLGLNLSNFNLYSTPVTTFAGGSNWKKISTLSNGSGGIKSDGTLWLWGDKGNNRLGINSTVQPYTPVTTFAGGSNWKDLSLSSAGTAAIKNDGTLWVWGAQNFGFLGNGITTFTNVSTPITTFAGGSNWKQISLCSASAHAIKTDGTLWAWGSALNGNLGNGQVTGQVNTPITTFAGGTNWKQVSAGNDGFVYAIKTDGTLWCWGYNYNGYLGLGETDFSTRSTPVTTIVGGTNWKQVSCPWDSIGAVKTDGTLWTWGYDNYGSMGRTTVGVIRNTPVTTFAGGTNWANTPTTNPEDLYTISMGRSSSLAIKTDGTLWCWGSNYNGQLGTGNYNDSSTPITTFAGGTNWKQISIGDSGQGISAAIKTDGTLWVWGYNTNRQLGTNSTLSGVNTPVTTFAGGTDWKQVSTGDYHTAAIKTDGTLWIWGRNANGQIGINSIVTTVSTPVTTFAGGTNWKQVFASRDSVYAIKTDGTLWVWGDNFLCYLGTNTNSNSLTPVTTFAGGTNWKQVTQSAAIKTDGTLWVWGTSTGNNSLSFNISTPVTTFAGGTNWKQVSSGANARLAVKTDGTLWSWGDGISAGVNLSGLYYHQSCTPVTTFAGGTDWVQCHAGIFNSIALKSNGTLWCWGTFGIGIGIPRNSYDAVPRQVFSEYSQTWKYVSMGNQVGAGIKNDGTLWTWGYAALGNGPNASASPNPSSLPHTYTPVTTFKGGTDWKNVSYTNNNVLGLTYIENY